MEKPFREIEFVALAGEVFTDNDARNIIIAVNAIGCESGADPDLQSPDVRASLNRLSSEYAAADYEQDAEPVGELIKRLEQVAAQAEKLTRLLGAEHDGHVDHDLGPGVLWASAKLLKEPLGQTAVANAVHGVIQIGRFANHAIGEQRRRNPNPTRGPRRDTAIADLIQGLGQLFEAEWLRKAGRSAGREDEGPGRFPAFVGLVLGRIAPSQFTPRGIDSLIRRHLRS